MRTKKLIALLASIALVLALVLSGCAQEAVEPEVIEKTVTETVTETVEKIVEVEKEYRALNPQGEFIPVETQALEGGSRCRPLTPRTRPPGRPPVPGCS